ncbi:hypothetical protein FS749_005300 [Ceratobasidium sp. UAMH 11750]|nr:hypothetical protein FS749_005300 [Ceratobasidium sp. UAMH 11750]
MQPDRFGRAPRAGPYSRSNGPPKITGSRPSAQVGLTNEQPQSKRLRESQPNPGSKEGQGQATSRAQGNLEMYHGVWQLTHSQVLTSSTTTGPGSSANGFIPATVNAALVDATRQLAQPREAPQPPQHVHTTISVTPGGAGPSNVDSGVNAEEIMEGLQAENDEILRVIYEGDGGNGADMRLYRLVAKMLQKQDAICRTLQGMKLPRRATTEDQDAAPNGDQPPRVSPPQPDKPVNWDQTVRNTEPAGRQPRVGRRILICEVIRANINKLLKREKKQPLPPPPPAEIRYPTIENFGTRWEEMEKSLFNRMAATVVSEYVCQNWQADALMKRELEELPGTISEHIRYLCRTWKDAHRVDAEDFKKARLLNASAAS